MIQFTMDKSHFSIANLHDVPDEREYWWSKTSQERLQAMEFSRQMVYGHDRCTARLQRVLEIAELPPSSVSARRHLKDLKINKKRRKVQAGRL